jgi:adhesin transport system outer membrane protein
MGELLNKEKVVVPAEAIAQTEVKSEARLPEMR